MKCEVCKQKIGELYLKKIAGTFVKDENGKRHPICHECQKKLNNDKKEMLKNI